MKDIVRSQAGNNQASRALWTLAATSFGFVVVQLDVTIVNVAMPQIGISMDSDMAGLQWLVNAYTLTFASFLLTAGTLGDYFGSRRIFCYGLILFGFASAACAFAPNILILVIARALQGIGAALIFPTSLSLLSHASAGDANARHHAIGWWSAIGGVVSAMGPVIGGALTDWFGWRAIFLVNVPICLFGLWACRTYVSETVKVSSRRFDLSGQILAVLALFFLTRSIIEAGSLGWDNRMVILSFALAAILVVAFMANEMLVTEPMLPLGLFRRKGFTATIVLGGIMNMTFYGSIFVLSIYFQRARDYTPVMAGFALLPFTIIMLANLVSARLSLRFTPRVTVLVGFMLSAFAFVMLYGINATTTYWQILPALLLLAFGAGIGTPTLISMIIGSVEPQRSATASAILNTARQVGSAIGVAVFGSFISGEVIDIATGAAGAFGISAILRFVGALIAIFWL